MVAIEVQAGADAEELSEVIGELLNTYLDLQLARLVDLPARSVPKTPTGKVRRHTCRQLMAQGLLGEKNAGLLHPVRFRGSLRDLGETLQGSGDALVARFRHLISDE